MAQDVSATVVVVTFSPPSSPNGIITRYQITYMETSIESSVPQTIDITENLNAAIFTVNITDLLAFTGYSISVRAATSIGLGEADSRTAFTDPAASSPPINVTAMAIASDAILVSWNYPLVPRGEIEGYVVRYYSDSPLVGGGTRNITLPTRDDDSMIMQVIGGLVPFTQYSFTVRAFSFGDDNMEHAGMESGAVMARTMEAGMCIVDSL